MFLLVVFFLLPLGEVLKNSVYNTTVETYLPNITDYAVNGGDRKAAIQADLDNPDSRRAITYLNHHYYKTRSMFRKGIEHPGWSDPKFWAVIDQEVKPYTFANFKRAANDLYLKVIGRTYLLSFVITLICLVVAYPLANFLTKLSGTAQKLALFIVLVPLFSSFLSRTVSWILLLQPFDLMNTFTAVYIGSVYIALPLSILPIYVAMKNVDHNLIKVSTVMGASKWQTFRYVYFPQTSKGVANSVILTFMSVTGYYITPSLLGGSKGLFVTEQIINQVQYTLNWGLASALTVIMLATSLIMFYIYYTINFKGERNA